MKNPLLILCLTVGLALAGHGQSDALRKLDESLTSAHREFVSASKAAYDQGTAQQFMTQMKAAMLDPITFDGTLDSLAQQITIRTSPDKRVKFYSWDAMEGGTWHTIHNFAQFRGADGSVQDLQLDTGNESDDGTYSDSGIEYIYEIVVDGQKFYLTRAWGTHGSGMQHQILRVYQFIDGNFMYCESCMGGEEGFVIEYPRSATLKFEFDPVKKSISYQTMKKPNAAGVAAPLGEWTTLILSPHIWKGY